VKRILVCNAWSPNGPLDAATSTVPELHASFNRVKDEAVELGYLITDYDVAHRSDNPPDGVIFTDCPALNHPLLKYCIESDTPFILVICENLHLQPNPTYPVVGHLAARILSYEASPMYPDHTTRLGYPVNLTAALEYNKNTEVADTIPALPRMYLLGMCATGQIRPHPGELYTERYKLAMTAHRKLKARFALVGRGWPTPPGRGALATSHLSKLNFFASCEFGVAMENNNGIPGYVTEKLFQVLAAGCIPVYSWNIPGVAIHYDGQWTSPARLVESLVKLTENDKAKYRFAGRAYLEKLAGSFHDENVYVQTFLETIKTTL